MGSRAAHSVDMRYGDERGGSPGFRVQTFLEEASPTSLRWQPDNDGPWQEFARHTRAIVGGAPAVLVASAPSRVGAGTPFELHLRLEDRWGNPATLATPIDLEITGGPDDTTVPQRVTMPACAWVRVPVTIAAPGIAAADGAHARRALPRRDEQPGGSHRRAHPPCPVLGRPPRAIADRLRRAFDRRVLRARPRLCRHRLRFAPGELLPGVGPRVGGNAGEHAAPSRRGALRQLPGRGVVGRVAARRRSQPVLSRRPRALASLQPRIRRGQGGCRHRPAPRPGPVPALRAAPTRWWRCTWAGVRPISNGTSRNSTACSRCTRPTRRRSGSCSTRCAAATGWA